ncbi:CLIP-associating protein 1 isoform X3 [Patella vulgata]|uniref:CLIP-associating protein 1 isoform X3 n=1 Tax=Patella vulgata TaxID=6465 RepID=UPI002180545E|nr:CLIP-associating protein 1 isoform X3 [Patella vulgata]
MIDNNWSSPTRLKLTQRQKSSEYEDSLRSPHGSMEFGLDKCRLERQGSLRRRPRTPISSPSNVPCTDVILHHLISVNGLEVLCLMVDRMGEEFKPHVSTVLPACIDRLGDAKDQVRDQAQQLLLKLMLPASSPQYVFERMMPAFNHKLWHVREGCLICLAATINRYGARSLQLSKIVPSICKLLEDQNAQVREEAINTMTEIYRHVGERVRIDLGRKTIPPQRLKQLFTRFDEVKSSGNMLPTADIAPSRGSSSACNSDDELDFAKPMSTKAFQAKRVPTSAGTKTRKPLVASKTSSASTSVAGAAGAMDEELFIKSFEDVPKIQIFSARDVQDNLQKAQSVLSNPNEDWEKRIEVLKVVRSLVIHGATDHDEFYQSLRSLESSFNMAAKDLRSQVVREACITIAYLAQTLGHKFDHFAESVFQTLFQLVPNTAKVMSTSGVVCIRFIVQYVFTPRLIPQITGNLTSKSNILRRYSCELLNQLLHIWPTHILERHIALLQDAIKRGISDADSEARSFSRKAFWGFADHFKDQADALLNNLDSSKQKMLQGEISGSSSSNSINSNENNRMVRNRARSASQDRSLESSTLTRNSGARRSARYSSSKSDAGGDLEELAQGYQETLRVDKTYRNTATSSRGIMRSSSAVDLAATNGISPRPRTTLLSASRLAPGSTNSLPRQKSSSTGSKSVKSLIAPSPNRSRNRTRMGMSQSQPGSRSNSPSSRLNYLTHTTQARTDSNLTPNRTRKSMPRSQGASREASPNRNTYGRERRLSGSKIGSGGKTSLMTHRLLRHGSELEDSIADALRTPNRKTYNYDSDDGASETSSVCSERSYTSYSGRTSESSDTERIHHLSSAKRKDMQEILACMASGSYTERKEGLISLQLVLRANRYLSRGELKKVTEIFTRMFHDPHSKVFSIFMDTLVYLINLHHQDLLDWLYVLVSRLLIKTGSEMLGSVNARLQKALDTVRLNFPFLNQFNTVTKFITDQFLNQSPNLKIKISVLNFLHALANQMDSSALVNSTESRVAISKIISWTTEPHVEVRKSAQNVLIALFNCNSAEFSLILSAIPKPFQDGATKILHNHIRTASSSGTSDVLSQRNVASLPHNTSQQRSRPPSRSSLGHPDDNETENLNPEDIYNSIKKTTADIHNLSINSKLDHYEDIKKKRDFTSQDSGIQDLRNDSPDGVDGKRSHYNPTHYQENILNGKQIKTDTGTVFDADELFNESLPANQGELIIEILTELSNHNTRNDERKNAMYSLTQLTRKGDFKHWDEHFKNILLILLETLGDDDAMIRAFSLRVLKEILQKESHRFEEYAELTIFRILEAHKDSAKEVVKASEECSNTLAKSMATKQTMKILISIIESAKFPVNMAAIKMQAKVIELLDNAILLETLSSLVPGLLKACEDADSHVRKAAVFALVATYNSVGEELRPHLISLSSSKMKLLNLYIKRNQSTKDGARSLASPNFSDT